ncbi:hypothetical protein GS597_00855 [Synechococcales cyanobacterium C]|uniref:Biotin carboxylase n=1 Tax=Petrachloros mirabilis ULC683 TaxID=2781853 RepID=A0A8K2AN98_9CYAN|nr:hypothetical protein [Petrachloros mirabilis]NCJ05088.1 hypothetical protein [Petrachloros mirabilis ULC683]
MRNAFVSIRHLLILGVASLLVLLSSLWTSPAWALTQIQLTNLSYHNCPPELARGMVTAGGPAQAANCFMIAGTAVNKSGKPVIDADVFGRIYDANNNPVFQNRNRVGAIEVVPPGESDFEIRISVPEEMPTPLKLEQFKAAGFVGKVR